MCNILHFRTGICRHAYIQMQRNMSARTGMLYHIRFDVGFQLYEGLRLEVCFRYLEFGGLGCGRLVWDERAGGSDCVSDLPT